jgi:uroporphyrin-III C-methyltransferase/precorrin-2 dehydrogenase/sirohydrochlorin ferrochelatase
VSAPAESASGYPLLLELTGREAVVVGGGAVAARRVRGLITAGARVRVVAPSCVPEIREAAQASAAGPGEVRIVPRTYRDGDLAGAWLVHACTSDPEVNAAVAAEAERLRVWCVRADDSARTATRTPAVARGGGVTVAVSAGDDPRRAAAVRDTVALLLSEGRLPLRHHRPPAGGGSVALVGGGPGDPGLITVRGRRLLAEADVVVVDKLAPRALLDELDPDVDVVDAGKAPHAHNLTQDQINALIVDRAVAGQRVVRLKGGDPFVFGRGSEEVAACVAAGVAVQVVPGITSALAVPAAAGIPVTHRGLAQEFTVVSAHVEPGHPDSTLDWAALAATPGTLVLLMAVGRLPAITAELLARGRDPATPAAVIASGTMPDQVVIRSPLADLPTAAAGIAPPAVVVIGAVARLGA